MAGLGMQISPCALVDTTKKTGPATTTGALPVSLGK